MRWLNDHLAGDPISPEDADHVLTHAGFPIEAREDHVDLPDGADTVLDVELTSNRGDCLCHVGLAREVAASTGRELIEPAQGVEASGPPTGELVSLTNEVAAMDACPRFLARVVRGVKVGPSPAWLQHRLQAVGVKTINNVVDATNFVLFELGHPSHAFDRAKLIGPSLVIRHARDDEKLLGLDDREHTLRTSDLVVADAERAVSVAGVIGGRSTSVTDGTTDVVLEMATWSPSAVRRTARRLGVTTDSCYRYERFVDLRDLDRAMDRLTALVLELAGGEASAGVLDEGVAPPARTVVELRPARCARLLGIEVPVERIVSLLGAIGVEVDAGEPAPLRCIIPPHRHDLFREVDLIEEVIRLHGFEHLEMPRTLPVPLDLRQPRRYDDAEQAKRVIADVLVGAGYYETVTFSFSTEPHAELFLADGLRTVKIDEERRKDTPFLRPCITPGLLSVRRANQDARVEAPGGVKLFEIASTFTESDDGEEFGRLTVEEPRLSLLADAGTTYDEHQHALRAMKGVIEALGHALGGEEVALTFSPRVSTKSAFAEHAYTWVERSDRWMGFMGLLSAESAAVWDLEQPVVAAELDLDVLVSFYPPRSRAHALPAFPSIERDVSVALDEGVRYTDLENAVNELAIERLVGVGYVGSYRGKQVGAGRKSVTLRLEFRDDSRTLRHEEVDPEMERVVTALKERCGAELRT
ncbi:MAG: phenylalanine--tRNA ligase subunit beta [Planctomycetota bacterium]